MTTPSDEDLINMATKYFYQQTSAGGSGGSVTNQMDMVEIDGLNRKVVELNDMITLAEIEEETSNEMYLSSKQNPGKYGLFSAVGLRTTQDWILAYFFFSYVTFSVLLVLSTLRTVENKMSALLVFGGMGLLGVILYIAVMSLG